MKRTNSDVIMILLSYHDKVKAEQLAWHKANSPNLTEAQLSAFDAGFSDGWRQCISAIKLHNIKL